MLPDRTEQSGHFDPKGMRVKGKLLNDIFIKNLTLSHTPLVWEMTSRHYSYVKRKNHHMLKLITTHIILYSLGTDNISVVLLNLSLSATGNILTQTYVKYKLSSSNLVIWIIICKRISKLFS